MKPKMLIFAVAGIFLVGALFAFSQFQRDIYESKRVLKLPGQDVSLIEVNTSATRTRGLSGTKKLPENSGMLFTFDEADKHGIWMKDMYFPIDIFWINENYMITHIQENVSPDTYPTVFYPKEKSLYVLETNAGFAEKYDLKSGNMLQFITTNH